MNGGKRKNSGSMMRATYAVYSRERRCGGGNIPVLSWPISQVDVVLCHDGIGTLRCRISLQRSCSIMTRTEGLL